MLGKVEAAVIASDLAIVGYDDYQDTISVMALNPLSAGEVIYFTNNGWSSSLGAFNGADPSQGAGNESLLKLTLNQSIATGSVITSNVVNSAWTWTNSGLIPGQVDGYAVFSDLALDYESDQIYAFQGPTDNPLLNPTHFIYALNMGSADYPGFSDSQDSLTGDIPLGLSEASKTAFAQTNFSFHGDPDGNHSAWALNMNAPAIQQLLTSGGTNAQWLDAIANSDNWGPVVPSIDAAPEPSRAVLLLLGMAAAFRRRRRHR
ncbi:PEP-CTERM sorting domain-containing protein [Prosthecobacter sp.]|uniref:PEP-CTERM sorting domain-containing protein n=1 Tax=Prosthecobacter sp. TaxID=1965333 RepID=UPI0037830113